MILTARFTTTGEEMIVARLEGFRRAIEDLRWLADELKVVLEEETEAALRIGVDRYGNRVDDLSPETVKRRARAHRGSGPPRVPDEASRFLTAIRCEVTQLNSDTWRVTLWWEGMDFLRYHITGTDRMPERNPVGVTPAAMDRIRQLVAEAVVRILGGG